MNDNNCPRCIENYEGEDGAIVLGTKEKSDCKECGVCVDCEHLSDCSQLDESCTKCGKSGSFTDSMCETCTRERL